MTPQAPHLCGDHGNTNRRGDLCGNLAVIGQTACYRHGGGTSGKTPEYEAAAEFWRRLTKQARTFTEADDFDDHKRDLMALKCRQFEQRLPEIAATTDAATLDQIIDGHLDRMASLEVKLARRDYIRAAKERIRPSEKGFAAQITELTELKEDQTHGLPAEGEDDYTD